jgi:uncharacterized protein
MKSRVRPRSHPPRPWRVILLAVLIAMESSSRAAEALLPPLTTVSGNARLPGKFIWADLVTDDVSAARKFYNQLFGWQFLNAGGYYIAMNDSHPIGGMFQKPRPPNDPAAKPRWFGYISVSDVKKAERKTIKAGGRTILPPQNFPKRGEQAVFADPEGAIFGVIKSSSGDPEDYLGGPGDWIWIQLLSRNAQKAGEFYRAVAGYEVVETAQPERLNDYVLVSKGFARATVRNLRAESKDVNPTWLPYVRVEDVRETVRKAKEFGGAVLVEPKEELLKGRVAVISDPAGAAIGVLNWDGELAGGKR